MFAKRNSFTLAVIWIIILGAGSFWYFRDVNKLVELKEEEKNITEQLSVSQSQVKRLTKVETVHDDISLKWADAPKRIISAEEPSFTLSYLNWIITTHKLDILYDFVLNEKKKLEDCTQFTYTLSGEGTYNDIYRLIWYLTYEPILYNINAITLDRSSGDYLKFNIKLHGFTVEGESNLEAELAGLNEVRKTNGVARPRDIFEPLVKPRPVVVAAPKKSKPTLPPKQPGEIDVEKATLSAVTPNSIFISDGSSGVKELRVGYPVYLGRLVSINQSRNEAVFSISKFGVSQRVVLRIDNTN